MIHHRLGLVGCPRNREPGHASMPNTAQIKTVQKQIQASKSQCHKDSRVLLVILERTASRQHPAKTSTVENEDCAQSAESLREHCLSAFNAAEHCVEFLVGTRDLLKAWSGPPAGDGEADADAPQLEQKMMKVKLQ